MRKSHALEFKSGWRWVVLAAGLLFVLIGLSFVAEPFSASGLVVALACGIFGAAGCVASVLSGVRATHGGILERGLMGKRLAVKWSDIVGFTIGQGGSKWPSSAPVLLLADGRAGNPRQAHDREARR
ncbi:hypothetical protein [Actinokineospora alba]|uniref:hypothetical protein n=1 Tax=Actinokineospora alba TaxID=504798 RepID=UPI000B819273|nr:hypothetical protein [Actinokineospora alba]